MGLSLSSDSVVITGLPVGPLNGTYRMQTDGTNYFFQIKNATTGFFHTVFLQGDPPALVIGPSDESATQVDDGSFDPAGSAPANGTYRVKTDGGASYFQLKNATTGLWHTIFPTGASGAEQFAIGPGES